MGPLPGLVAGSFDFGTYQLTQGLVVKMMLKGALVAAGAARGLAAAVPQSSYGEGYGKPLVSSKPFQNLITSEG